MIPKLIHQIWIGPKPAPSKLMDTWKEKHPDFEYIRWSEKELNDRSMPLSCINRIQEIEEINGKADIIRWEILYHYGGVFLDADCFCLESLTDEIMNLKSFAVWENEQCRKGLVAPGAMGFPPKHPLVRACIEWIQQNPVSRKDTKQPAWVTVGPGLLTRMYQTNLYPDFTVLPSYYFLPVHYTGLYYNGHGRVYAHQEWGSSFQSYDKNMNNSVLSSRFMAPDANDMFANVSVLVSSYNTKAEYITQCLESVRQQTGHFSMELVWINDGSDETHTNIVKDALKRFEESTRFTTVVYVENDGNKGIGYSLNRGIELCSHEIIIKMDSDDIMVPNRIGKQLDFMKTNPNAKICGAQILMFRELNKGINKTAHSTIHWEDYKNRPIAWFMNHPTACYRKSAVLKVGNYKDNLRQEDGDDDLSHDFELELRMLKEFGTIHNLPDVLLHYRLHENQVTHNGGKKGKAFWDAVRRKIVEGVL